MSPALVYSLLGLTMILLAAPIVMPPNPKTTVSLVKFATMTSLLLAATFTNYGVTTTTLTVMWLTPDFYLEVGLTLDLYAVLFMPVALFIAWSILEFSTWYMFSDPQLKKFLQYLLLFLMAMLTLLTANNLLQLFVGWEGVGIMSFLLISWWGARPNASSAALQAVIYNRLGDIGLILMLAWAALHWNTWELQLMSVYQSAPTPILLGLVLAAVGKSAQIGLHPWLPAAMEGPTPVSALLHSSTMVVAGVFLLIRMFPLISCNQTILMICLCLGATTTLFAALCAMTQNDIKKIIAFSTLSQLGLMMLTIGLAQPAWAFLHITTHAFFKAMLFLCSGSIIHALNNEQDVRKMGGLQKSLPISTACLTGGGLALAGTPFLAAFYTKDTIIETMNTSTTNAWALVVSLLATALTAAYSLRLTFLVQLNTPRHPPTTHLNETNQQQTRPLLRLLLGSISAGLVMTALLVPNKIQIMTLPTTMKLSALLISIVGLLYALDLMYNTSNQTLSARSPILIPLNQLVFFNALFHRYVPNKVLKHVYTHTAQTSDLVWYEAVGPKLISLTTRTLSKNLTNTHNGLIKTPLLIFTTTLMLSLLLL